MSRNGNASENGGATDQDQWVMITQEPNLTKSEKLDMVKIRHPRSGNGAMFMFTDNDKNILEILKFDDPYRSWFIGQTVQQDGSLFMTTPVDPLFLVLQYIVKNQEKFIPLDQQITDEEFPECQRLCNCINQNQLSLISDMKGPDDLVVCKFNEEKTMEWLSKKVEKVADYFEKKDSHSNAKREDVVRYAFGVVSDYLSLDLSEKLKQHMGIKTPVHEKPTVEEPPSKKQKVEPLEDYSSNAQQKKDDKKGKSSAAQAKLEKVDKSGMKSISSFFAFKPKKTK